MAAEAEAINFPRDRPPEERRRIKVSRDREKREEEAEDLCERNEGEEEGRFSQLGSIRKIIETSGSGTGPHALPFSLLPLEPAPPADAVADDDEGHRKEGRGTEGRARGLELGGDRIFRSFTQPFSGACCARSGEIGRIGRRERESEVGERRGVNKSAGVGDLCVCV